MPQAVDEAGNIWEVDAQGNPVRYIGKQGGQQGGVFTVPQNPAEAAKEATRKAQWEREQALRIANINADLYKQGLQLGPDGVTPVPIPNWKPPVTESTTPKITAKERADAIAAYTTANQMDRLIKDMEAKFKEGPGSTSGLMGIADFFPTEANDRFDKSAQAVRGQVGTLLGFTGGQLNSLTEAQQAVGPYLPESGNYDSTSLDKIARLKDLSNLARERSIAILGGVPDQNGQITPLAQIEQQRRDPVVGIGGPGNSSVPPGNVPGGGGGPQLGLSTGESYTTPQDLAVAAAVNKALQAGASVEGLAQAAQAAGGQVTPSDLANFKAAIDARARGQSVTFNPQATGRRTALQQAAGAAMMSPLGTGIADATNMAGFGVLEGLLPDQFGAIRDINPNASMVGQVAGAIGGTEALAMGARAGLNAVAPNLASRALGGGRAAEFGRNLLTDATYGGTYGGVTQGDPLTGAALGAGGSALGQLGGKAIGKAMSGVDLSPAVQAMRDAKIPLTTGQTLGGIAKGVEDRLSGLPLVGDIVNARRLEGLRAFNERAMNDAVAPINGRAADIGNDGIQALYDQVGNAYDNATQGVTVPLDQQLIGEVNALRNGAGLPADYAARLNQALSNRLDPALSTGQITGDQFQQAMRGLKGYRASADKAAPGFEQDYRDVLSRAMDALRGQMNRGGGDSVVTGLNRADEAYRNIKTLDKAVTAARNGTGSGEVQVFTPAQLNNAATQAAQKFAGPRPFGDLIDSAQTVLPNKVPDSGTAGRLATYALPTVLGGGGALGAGAGSLAGDTGTGTMSGLALAAMLMAGGTKGGQKALEKVLTSRPGVVKNAGTLVRKKSGLFGAAAVPPLLAIQNQ